MPEEKTITREDINKQAYLLMTNIIGVKIKTNIDDKHHETLMKSFTILMGMFNDFINEKELEKNKVMPIKKFNVYRDGGTMEIITDEGTFCFDGRIESSTKGRLYNGYPKDNNSNLIENSSALEELLIEKLKNHEDDFYHKCYDVLLSKFY